MSQKEYAEETVFWSLKAAQQFSARRRSTLLFLANATTGPSSYYWIDNTPKVWSELREVLGKEQPASIVVNTDPQIAFSSGLHAGELEAIKDGIGAEWAGKLAAEPLVAVEYIATMVKDRAAWYRRLQSTAWAIISEAFSERVITPGETTTTVRMRDSPSLSLQCVERENSKTDREAHRTWSGGCARRSSR